MPHAALALKPANTAPTPPHCPVVCPAVEIEVDGFDKGDIRIAVRPLAVSHRRHIAVDIRLSRQLVMAAEYLEQPP